MIKKLLYFIAFVLFLVLAYQCYEFYSFTQKRNAFVQEQGVKTTNAIKNQVNDILVNITEEAERLAQLFGSNDYSAEEIRNIIRESALSIPEIQGVTAGYEPFAFSAKERLFCPYYDKGSQSYIAVEETYDYTEINASSGWYTSVRDNGAKWVEPYFATAAQDWYVDYGIPFHYKSGPKKGQVRGTITMSFICSGFKNLVHSLSLGKTGYGIITSNKGKFLSHPINEYIGQVTLQEVMEKEADAPLMAAYEAILKGESGNTAYTDKVQKDKALFFYDKIPASGWGIGSFFYKSDLLGDEQALNRRYIRLALVFSAFLLCLIALFYNRDHLDEGEIWQLSALATILLLANIFLVGYLQHNSNIEKDERKSPPIVDLATLGTFIQNQEDRADKLKVPKSTSVPTGIYIQRMEFIDSYNVNIGGTVWQKYPLEVAEKVQVGFSFPQMSPFSEAAYIEEAYRKEIAAKEGEAGYLLVGWEVRVTLLLDLFYEDFPLDKGHINIKLQPLDNNDYLIFTPDLVSYNYTTPSKKGGLNPEIDIPGIEILKSYFNYTTETYEANFGYGDSGLFEEVPVLHYNIHLRRILLNSFVTYLIPIFVTLVMVFILIYACDKSGERQGIIESMAAFFFVLIFSHIDLRKDIVTADLIYIEFFYFFAYFMLILSTFNMITYTKDRSKIFDFNENQLFKATFFPLFFILILVVTIQKFY